MTCRRGRSTPSGGWSEVSATSRRGSSSLAGQRSSSSVDCREYLMLRSGARGDDLRRQRADVGESGTGKELVANAIHEKSARRDGRG